MKKGVHPTVYKDAKVTCSCGAVFEIPGTVQELTIEICSNCHPHYTGKVKVVDTAGRIDRFKAKMAAVDKFKQQK